MSWPMTTTTVANMLGCSNTTVRYLCDNGLLRHYKVPGSKHRRITPEAVRELMECGDWPAEVRRKFALSPVDGRTAAR